MAQTPQTAKTWSVLDSGTHKPTGDKVTISGLDVYPTSRRLGGTGDVWVTAEYIEFIAAIEQAHTPAMPAIRWLWR
jgi:hypothetical protein